MESGLMEQQNLEELGFVKELEWKSEQEENQAILDRIRMRKEKA